MESEFSGKRALVTGAARGIGKAVTKKLLECGASVVALDKLSDLLDSLKSEFPSVETICVDLVDWEATKKAVTEAGNFDLLVNNAGIYISGKFGQYDEESMDKMWAVNVKAPMNISQVVADSLKERGKPGAIVNICSYGTQVIFPGTGVYTATKSALLSLTRAMALALIPHQIRCNLVHPGVVNTEMTRHALKSLDKELISRLPLGKDSILEPEEIAESVAFLLSDKRAGKIIGHSLFTDGGGSL